MFQIEYIWKIVNEMLTLVLKASCVSRYNLYFAIFTRLTEYKISYLIP